MATRPAGDRREPRAAARDQELTRDECFELLARSHLGRIALVDAQGPAVFPVNFVLDRHMVVIRTEEGTKLDTASRGGRVAFEVDDSDPATRSGWSVLIRGEAVEVTGPAELARLRELPLHPWAPGARSRYVRILPAVVTGRRISRRDSFGDGAADPPPAAAGGPPPGSGPWAPT